MGRVLDEKRMTFCDCVGDTAGVVSEEVVEGRGEGNLHKKK